MGSRLTVLVLLLTVPWTVAYPGGRSIMLATGMGGLVLAIWWAAGVWRRTRRDVGLAVAGVTAMAEGDFAVRPLPAGPDELGDLGRALGSARSRLATQETKIKNTSGVRAEQLRISFLHQRQAEVRLRVRAQAIIDESTSAITGELRRVTDQVADVRLASDTIDREISATDAATAAVVDHAHRAEEVITSLEQSLRRVAATAAMVQGIAGQTRLLALNATIEAARAGQLGLGFTVVADEVKDLATTTSNSTEQIAATIDELERDTARMTDTIAAMVAGIGSVGDAAVSLRAVAADQATVVGRLAQRMGHTIDRVEQMSGLAAQLERRQGERIPAAGPAELRVDGDPEPIRASLVNVSSGGMRVAVDPAAFERLTVGDVVDARLGAGPDAIPVHARVANRHGNQVGIQLLITDDAQAAQVEEHFRGLSS